MLQISVLPLQWDLDRRKLLSSQEAFAKIFVEKHWRV